MADVEERLARIEAQQQAILDRHAIENTIARYARGIDRLDLELLKSVFHPDGMNHSYDGDGNLHDWCETVIPALASFFAATMHHITHKSIEIVGDRAVSESYFIAWHLITGDRDKVVRFFGELYASEMQASDHLDAGHEHLCGGRYLHRWERRDGVWRISERIGTIEWNHFGHATPAEEGSLMATIRPMAHRNSEDPVYALFASEGASAG